MSPRQPPAVQLAAHRVWAKRRLGRAWALPAFLLAVPLAFAQEAEPEHVHPTEKKAAIEDTQRPLTRAEQRSLQSYADGCPVVCGQGQACVAQHCVDMCHPECREGSYCTPQGTCDPLPEPEAPLLTEEDQQRISGAASRDSKALIFADVGGIIGYGVRPGIEYGERNSFIARLHLLNTGILSHAVFVENEYERFDWGFGVSFGYRHYQSTWGNLRGFYVGGGLDYSISRLISRSSADITLLRQTAAPYGEFGYRWVFGSFAIGFGPTLALRYPIFAGVFGADKALCTTEIDCEETSRRLEGTLNVEVGWFQ